MGGTAQYGEHAARENGREPAYAVPARGVCVWRARSGAGWRRRAGPDSAGLRSGFGQAVVEDCWAHRALLLRALAGVCLGQVWREEHSEIRRRAEGSLKSCCRGGRPIGRPAAGRRGQAGGGLKRSVGGHAVSDLSTADCLCWLPAVVPMADDACVCPGGERWARGGSGA